MTPKPGLSNGENVAVNGGGFVEPKDVTLVADVVGVVLGEVGAGGTSDKVQAPDFAASVGRNGYSILLGYLYYPHTLCDAPAPGDVGLPQAHCARAGDGIEAVMRELVLAACYERGLHISL